MTILKSKSISKKFKRSFAFKNWRRNISGKEKQNAKFPKELTQEGF